jgi:putative thiazole-containing bacteriocin maturation protein
MESGLPKLNVLITDSALTNRKRLTELAEQARRTDPEVLLEEISLQKEGANSWRDVVQPFQLILYVSQEGDVEELRLLHAVCKAEKKIFLPAMFSHQTGMAGPVVYPESEGCWESAWRRVHHTAVYKDPELHAFSSTAGAMLANVIVFELFKTVTGESELRNSCFLLDLETLEGSWHPFMPHPLIRGCAAAQRVQVSNLRLEGSADRSPSSRLLPYFNRLTSAQTGILHIWEEGDLRQLPLSQCRVQTVDPLSEGPAGLLPDLVCTGLTHEEARREAGLTGIELYVSRLASVLVHTKEIVGIGVGETAAEGVIRGLQANLAEQLIMQQNVQKQSVIRVQLSKVEDERCRFYLQALTAMRGAPMIGLGEEVSGFPVVWVGTGDYWYGSVGMNMTMALQKVLKAALHAVQNNSEYRGADVLKSSTVHLGKAFEVNLVIPSSEGIAQPKVLREAVEILKKNGKQLFVVDLAVEPFLKEGLEGVFGVLLQEEESK